jgi:signal transduction histidine kinase
MLANLQAEADELPLPDDMVLTITDRNGSILVRTPDGERWVGQQHTDMVLQEIATTGTGVVEAIGVDGVPRLYATVPVRGPSGAEVWLSVGRTPEVLYAGVGQAVTRNIAGLGAILLVALAALWIGSDRLLLRRIDGLVDASTRLAAGEWEARAPASAQGDELDRLSSTFNAMADTLVQRQQELIDREQGLQAAWERAELAAARIARLQEVTADLAAALTPTEVTEVVLRKGAAALQAVAMSLKLISEDGEWLESGDVFDFPETIRGPYQRYPLNAQTPVAEAVRTGEAIWLRSEQEFIARYPHLAQDVKALAFEAAAALPLKLGDRTVGALGISFRTELAFDGEEREYLLTLASQCAQALERTRLYAWEQQARMDLEMRVSERTAELERSNRELNQFAYVASHDLKAPLRAIDNLAGWISEDAAQTLPPRSAEHLLKMRGRVKRMEQLLEDLLAYSRAGRVRPPAEIVDVERLVADVTALLGPPVGFTVIVQTPGVRLRTPRVSLELVLRNLIGNAIKHHTGAGGTVWVRAVEQGEMMEFSVRDNGPGIDPRYHARIFEMFQTLQPRDQTEGSGMGLAIVKKLVESYGGEIRVDSALGKGATFCFTWPRGV